MGIITGLISMVCWGTGDFLAALASRRFGNLRTNFWMMTVSFILATAYFTTQLTTFTIASVQPYLVLLIAVAVFQAIAYLAFYRGLETGMVSVVSPVGASFALVTVILSVLFYGEHLKLTQVTGILLISSGIIGVSLNLEDLKKIRRLSVVKGVREALVAMMGWGISLFLIVPASKALGWFLPVYIFRFFAIIFILAANIVSRQTLRIPIKPGNLLLLLPIGIFDISAFFSYSLGVSSQYASVVASVGGAFAMVTVLLARVFLREKLHPNQLAGIAAIIAGIALISY
ncbi:hypothetical protein A2Z33_04210 [Candidatus Gottesmanbacteria bacterium RBG_16_52_11]|uniref:EamA domain-containing protein n=1 Tax=Candidatus Gottesmanbacteria bacterium RBG_16_52_11 TaxID=1798374 RepID=A0A1F5YW64_9BACT|nr:MAG: hypothetical protein A2Z33_04210 [Candidatus Gottesmanbacteria bacterium RBG_16_52_11]